MSDSEQPTEYAKFRSSPTTYTGGHRANRVVSLNFDRHSTEEDKLFVSVHMQMPAKDARELATALIAAADFAEGRSA